MNQSKRTTIFSKDFYTSGLLLQGLSITLANMGTRKLTSILIAVVMGASISACQMGKCGANKDIFLRNFDAFIEAADDRDYEVTDEEWTSYDVKFKGYVEDCYESFESDMTNREKRQFWVKSLKYYATRYGEGMLNELSSDDLANQQVRDHIDEMLEDTGKDLEDFLEKSADELEVLFEDIGNDIEAWAERIKEMLEE